MGHTAPKVGQTERKPAEPPKPAAIHEEMLRPAAGTAGTRRRDQASDVVQLAAAVHRQQVAGKLAA